MYCITVQTIGVTLLISYEDARFDLNVSEFEFYSP